MKLHNTLGLLGLWILILPFLGFPPDWKTVFLVVTGIVLLYVAYRRHQISVAQTVNKQQNSTFVENNKTNESESSSLSINTPQ